MGIFSSKNKSSSSSDTESTSENSASGPIEDNRSEALEQAELQELQTESNIGDEAKIAEEVEVASEDEKSTTDKLLEVGEGTKTASDMAEAVGTISKTVQSPAKEGAKILEDTAKSFDIASAPLALFKKIGFLASPIITAGKAVLTAKTKWGQWTAFTKSAEKDNAPEEAKYAVGKVAKGFAKAIKDIFFAILDFTSNLLLLIPGAQMVGGAIKVFNNVVSAFETLYKGGKRFWQMFKGQKKEKNSSSLLDKALGGDQEALELILELKLGSIAGSGYKIIDKLTGIPNYLKEKITDNEFASKVGVDPIRAQRVIDSAGLGSGGPKDTKTLLEHLLLVCNKKKNPASYDIVKSEIQDAMTGVGV